MPKILPDKSEILSRVTIDPDTGCWLWNGPTNEDGYGKFYCRVLRADGSVSRYKSHYPVHVVAWEVWNGPLEPGLELDHLCRTRRCCRPSLANILDSYDAVLGTTLSTKYPDYTPPSSRPTPPALLLALGQHLEPVTHQENVRRSNSPPGINARKETCPKGHSYTERTGEPGTGLTFRYCKTCKNEARRASPGAAVVQ